MGLAREFDLPVLVVGDIDRGGVFASFYGTVEPARRGRPRVGKGFRHQQVSRGRVAVATRPRPTDRTDRHAVPRRVALAARRSGWTARTLCWSDAGPRRGPISRADTLNVAAVRFPRLSNATDLDALACEPGVSVTVTTDPVVLRSADIIVLPGSRATVSDLDWLRRNGLADEVSRGCRGRANRGRHLWGISDAGATTIDDAVESEAGAGRRASVCSRPPCASAPTSSLATHRRVVAWTPSDRVRDSPRGGIGGSRRPSQFLDGCRQGSVWGTTWHGTFENDDFRRAFLAEAAHSAGVPFDEARPAGAWVLPDRREAMIDRLADAVEEHLDTRTLLEMVGH